MLNNSNCNSEFFNYAPITGECGCVSTSSTCESKKSMTDVAISAVYRIVPHGTSFGPEGSACASGTYVASVTECERAAVMLGHTDTSVYQGGEDNPSTPHGCFITTIDNPFQTSGSLNFNVNTANKGTDLTSTLVPVCRGKLSDKLVPTHTHRREGERGEKRHKM